MPIAPWRADSLAHVQAADVLEPIYRVDLAGINPAIYPFDVWDVEVSLDGGRRPYAEAKFKTSAGPLTNPATSGGPFQSSTPYRLAIATVYAGYHRTVAGSPVDDMFMLFRGYVTSREVITDAAGAEYVQWTAASLDKWLDFPSNRVDTAVSSTRTSVKDLCDAVNASASRWWRDVTIVEEAAYMNVPTSAQRTAFRALTCKTWDSVAEFVQQMALALGQWTRPDVRSVSTPSLIICADPYPYRAATALARSNFASLSRVESLDQWANVLDLTLTWADSSGSTVTKRRVYTNGTPNNATPIAVRQVNLTAYPPGGAMPASYALANAWLRRIGAMQAVKYSGQARAMYWLQPRIDGIDLTDNGRGDTAGPIDSITYQVDAGTMTVNWTAANAYVGL